jgi:protein-tyrosine phosphatase
VAQIDDGARTIDEGLEMLRLLRELGFGHVVATPHMRPGMFNNTVAALRVAFEQMTMHTRCTKKMPDISLGSEHFFDDRVLREVKNGHGLPYRRDEEPGIVERKGGALLIEFADLEPEMPVKNAIFQLRLHGYLPVIAHPERYRCVWGSERLLVDLIAQGAVALLDTAALVGKYGKRPQDSARALLEGGRYAAACSDAHRPADVELVAKGIEWIRETYGDEEVEVLFKTGPAALLDGRYPSQDAPLQG